jgi:hypothetical protein
VGILILIIGLVIIALLFKGAWNVLTAILGTTVFLLLPRLGEAYAKYRQAKRGEGTNKP